MNAADVLKYGHRTVLETLEGVPMAEWETAGVCGVWSVKEIVVHLASFEELLAEVLATQLESGPTPTLDELLAVGGERFNDLQVPRRRGKPAEAALAEYSDWHARVMPLLARIPAETLRQPGTIPWYGEEYALEDLLVYQYYGHKREHCAQVNVFRDRLKGRGAGGVDHAQVARRGHAANGGNTMTTVERPGAGTDATDKSFPWAFFILAYGFTWLICLPGVLAARRLIALPIPTTALIAVAQFGPTLAAFLLVARAEGRAGAKRLLGRALAWRIPARWLVPTLLLPPALAGLALALGLAGGAPRPDLPLLAQPLAILPSFVFIFLLQGPVPEEFGWRGYALDRLQRRWGALGASLVLGALWATWHLPLFLMGGFHSFVPPWAFFVRVVADAIVLTWLYNNTGGNLLVALLYHTTTNLAVALFPPIAPVTGGDQRVFLILTALHALVAAAVVARWGATTLTRRRPARAWPALAAARN